MLSRSTRNGLLACALMLAVMVGVWAFWQFQSRSLRDDFIRALQSGQAAESSVELRDKVWSASELATVEVLKVPASAGREQALLRSIHSRGRIVLPAHQYQYQATVRDEGTNLVHLFGRSRAGQARWRWVGIHPDSLPEHVRTRAQQLEELKSTPSP